MIFGLKDLVFTPIVHYMGVAESVTCNNVRISKLSNSQNDAKYSF